MNIVRTTFLAIALLAFSSPALATTISLGAAGQYNAFIFNDYTSPYGDTQGRLAVGGNATISSYSIGEALPSNFGDSLVVGGDLKLMNSQVNNGGVRIGSDSAASLTSATYESLSHGDLPFNFADEITYLVQLSNALSELEATGDFSVTGRADWYNKNLNISGTDETSLLVFNITESDFAGLNQLIADGIAADTTILINVAGESASLSNMNMDTLADYNVLFNFYQATSLTLGSVSVKGSILAPYADVEGWSGNIDGTLIASSFYGSFEQHNVPFDDYDNHEGTPVPEPGTVALLGLGLVGVLAWRKKR